MYEVMFFETKKRKAAQLGLKLSWCLSGIELLLNDDFKTFLFFINRNSEN